ncbi:MAG: sigma-54 dependent transcriptional regulator [Chloroherpetonaceae bacterium]|nr:sigma-54 dependent transcriptional regulator [Chloroherpetonaceae bacterium]
MHKVFVVDDDPSFRTLLVKILSKDYEVTPFSIPSECVKSVESNPPNLVVTDFSMPEINGVELVRMIKSKTPEVPVIVLTAFGSIEMAVQALQAGAFHYLEKKFSDPTFTTSNFTVLRTLVQRAIESGVLKTDNSRYKQEVEVLSRKVRQYRSPILIGESHAMANVRSIIEQVASIDSTVLIRGETGSGKNVAAEMIHHHSTRSGKGQFVEINCAALPENLLEAELFGYEQGAFTDARSSKKGLFEIASNGTIFLDEIDAASLLVQSKLLTVLETRTFRRLGGNKPISVDVRIICASNSALEEKVAKRDFREDLFFRINVVSISMPPLRELGSDIILIAEKFIEQFSVEMNKPIASLTDLAKEKLLSHYWKGNVRELRNVMERAVIFTKAGDSITPEQIILSSSERIPKEHQIQSKNEEPIFSIPIGKSLEEVKWSYIQAILNSGKSYGEAAKTLGISAKALWEIRKRNGYED